MTPLHHQVGGSRIRGPLKINYVGTSEDLRAGLNGVNNSLNRLGTRAKRASKVISRIMKSVFKTES